MVLEQEVGHLGVAIVTGHMERSVAHLQGGAEAGTQRVACVKKKTTTKKTREILSLARRFKQQERMNEKIHKAKGSLSKTASYFTNRAQC